jgi:GNAT superfamily N-acetyltransferase
VLTPELRGRGLGRELVKELVSEARAQAFKRLELHTFSLLTVAARIYRGAGFRLLSAREYDDWGPRLTYQLYVLELGG